MKLGRLFGTDGVRGIANRDLTPELAFKLGWAGGMVLGNNSGKPKVVVGRDTRVSGHMLEAAIVSGLTSVGATALLVGIVPTPAVAFLTKALQADAGVMISASHNPVEYNGIKYFSGSGYKLPDEVEDEIETLMFKNRRISPEGGNVGGVRTISNAEEQYCKYIRNTIGCDLKGIKVVVDCGYGASYRTTPRTLKELGAEVVPLNNVDDGLKINVQCGSTDPSIICKEVSKLNADLGIAHDGDADRVIACDEKGNIVDGDYIMAICGLHLMNKGQLKKNTIVATDYSNLGLKNTMTNNGGAVLVAKNGDRYVLEKMIQEGLILGGEKSGHIIFLEHNTTGDGLLTALQVMAVIKEQGKPLSELASVMKEYPQVLLNIKVSNKEGLDTNKAVIGGINKGKEKLEKEGRLFVRASGTEPVIRVMGEGPDKALVESVVNEVGEIIRRELM